MQIEECGNSAEVFLIGELDVAAAIPFRDALVGLIGRHCHDIVLNFREVTFLGSSGLGVMVGALKRVRAQGGDVRLRSLPRQARRVLEMTELIRIFEVLPDRPEADLVAEGATIDLREAPLSRE
jgi:anti-sigma B factor antagonist